MCRYFKDVDTEFENAGNASPETISVRKVGYVVVVVAIIGVAMGVASGWVAGQSSLEANILAKYGQSPEGLNDRLASLRTEYDKLYAHCEPLEGSERDMLINAQITVDNLEDEIAVKEGEIADLEVKAKESLSLRRELIRRKTELKGLKQKLVAAEQERTGLIEKLEEALVEVSVAKGVARQAKRDTMDERWERFLAETMLQVCEKGSRNKLEKCRNVVKASFSVERERRYRECVRARNSVPQLRHADKSTKELPMFAEWLDQDSRFTKNRWYFLFCDPTLPEAGDGVEQEARETFGESDPGEAKSRKDALLDAIDDDDFLFDE